MKINTSVCDDSLPRIDIPGGVAFHSVNESTGKNEQKIIYTFGRVRKCERKIAKKCEKFQRINENR